MGTTVLEPPSTQEPISLAELFEIPFSVTKGKKVFTIRYARKDELEAIGWAAAEAFIDDPLTHFFGGATKVSFFIENILVLTLY